MQATEDLGFGGFFLGSFEIEKFVYEKAKEGRWLDLVDLLHTAASNPVIGSISGKMLERYGHESCILGVELDDDDVREVFRPKGPGKEKGAEGHGLRQKEGPAEEGVEEGAEEGAEASEKEPGRSGKRDEAIGEVQEAFRSPKKHDCDSPRKPINLAEKVQTYVTPKASNRNSYDALVCPGDSWNYVVQFTRNQSMGFLQKGLGSFWNALLGAGRGCESSLQFHWRGLTTMVGSRGPLKRRLRQRTGRRS
jgi:hypothetical protein